MIKRNWLAGIFAVAAALVIWSLVPHSVPRGHDVAAAGTFAIYIIGVAALAALLVWFFRPRFVIAKRNRATAVQQQKNEAARNALGLSDDPSRAWMQARPHIDVGIATGLFRALGGKQTPETRSIIAMDESTACRGTIVMGPPGSGKTSAVMLPMLEQAIEQGWSALVFAIKPDVAQAVHAMARHHGREGDVLEISPVKGSPRMNPLHSLTPEAGAEGLADGLGDPRDPYWRDAPAQLVQGHLELLAGIGDRNITFDEIKDKDGEVISPSRTVRLSYSFDALRETIMLEGADLRKLLRLGVAVCAEIAEDPDQQERLQTLEDAINYFNRDYAASFERSSKGAENLAGLRTALLAPLKALAGNRDIRFTFCTEESDVDLNIALNTGKIVVVYVDFTKFPSAFPALMRLIFRVFSRVMQRRTATPNAKPCMLWMDEYASFASDHHTGPLSLCRQAGIVPVIGFQSLSFLAQQMKSKEAAMAIVGSCASLIICGATDDETPKLIQMRVGDGRWIESRQTSVSTGSNRHTAAGVVAGFFSGGHLGALSALLSNSSPNEISTTTTLAGEVRQENLAAAERLSALGPTGDGNVLAIGVIAQSADGELRDMMILPQIPYLKPKPALALSEI